MSNPTVTIGNSIATPSDPKVERTTFTKIVYDAQKFNVYGIGKFDPAYTSFNPTSKGDEFYLFIPLDNALAPGGAGPNLGIKPDFVSYGAWAGLKESASGFITAVNSVMPKIIIPTEILVDNGLVTTNNTSVGSYLNPTSGNYEGLFNWELVTLNGGTVISKSDTWKYAQTGAHNGSLYVSSKAKNDISSTNEMKIKLTNPSVPSAPPQGSAHDWLAADSSNLVVGGAFILMLNVVPSRPASASASEVSKTKWTVTLEFGEVKMIIDDSGSAKVTLGYGSSAADEKNAVNINLAVGKAAGGPPQQQHITDKDPFLILVYPVWNGLVIASGIQDAYATVFSSSYYVQKLKEAAVLNPPYSNGFDPSSPAEVEVGVGTSASNPNWVLVDFGTQLNVTANNCRFDLAYLPCFFSKECWFDEWRLQNDDISGTVSYTYNVYPIWTKNNTTSDLSPAPSVDDSGFAGSITNTHYAYTQWRLHQDHYNRFAGEIFASILEVNESLDFPIKNGNGSFDIVFTATDPADPSPSSSWKDYIQSITVTTNLDGSSGSMTVDKFGIAGQDASVTQSIGAITIDATGANGTVAGSIFMGLAMGISENRTSDGATWTVPLVGLEKKMDDLALLNVPFCDGETLAVVGDFLCKYAGLIADFTNCDSTRRLGMTDDINSVRFDWKAGTSVRSAMEDMMKDLNNHYVVRDGKVFFYLLDDTTGLPTTGLGPDRSTSYPDTRIVTYDANPDFEDIRNEIAVVGLEQVPDGQNTLINGLPTFPRMAIRSGITTTPDIPWAKVMVQPLTTMKDMTYFNEQADRLAAKFSVYELMGKTTIPGNAEIKPYDKWGTDLIISGVTHNIDFRSKTWTTDLEFMRKSR